MASGRRSRAAIHMATLPSGLKKRTKLGVIIRFTTFAPMGMPQATLPQHHVLVRLFGLVDRLVPRLDLLLHHLACCLKIGRWCRLYRNALQP